MTTHLRREGGRSVNAKLNRLIGLVILFSLSLKIILFYSLYNGDPQRIMLDDSLSYLIPAHSFLTTGHFLEAPHAPMIFRTPGYPAFLAAVFYLFKNSLVAVIIIQIILSAIPVVCSYLIGRKLFSENTGLCAALFVAFDYLLWGHSYFILSDTLFAVMLSLVYVIGVYFFIPSLPPLKKGAAERSEAGDFQAQGIRYQNPPALRATPFEKGGEQKVFFLGLFLALATLIRPASYFLFFFIFVGLILYGIIHQFSWKKTLITLLVFSLPNLLLVGGWQLRNHFTLGTYQYSKIAGALGMHAFFPENYHLYEQAHSVRDDDPYKIHLGLKEDAQIILQHPLLAAKQITFGAIKTLMMPDRAWMQLIGNTQDMVSLDEVKQDIYQLHLKEAWQNFQKNPFHSFTFSYIVGAITISFLLYFLIATYVVSVCNKKLSEEKSRVGKAKRAQQTLLMVGTSLRSFAHPTKYAHIFLLTCAIYFLLISSNADSSVRYRLPFELLIDVYAAAGLIWFYDFFRERFNTAK